MTVEPRITFDLDAEGFETDVVDEIVLDGRIHLEMLTGTSAYLAAYTAVGEHRFNVWASPVSRKTRRDRLRQDQDRLIDHARSLLPWGGSMWGIPVWRRPAAVVRDWWTARQFAGVALTVRKEE